MTPGKLGISTRPRTLVGGRGLILRGVALRQGSSSSPPGFEELFGYPEQYPHLGLEWAQQEEARRKENAGRGHAAGQRGLGRSVPDVGGIIQE